MGIVGKTTVYPYEGGFRAVVQVTDELGRSRPLTRRGPTAAKARKAVEEAAAAATRLRPSAKMSVSALCDAYIKRCEEKERAETTMRDYRGISAHIKEHLGHLPVSSLTAAHIEEMLRKCGGDGKRAINTRAFLRAAINRIARKAEPTLPNVAAIAEPPKSYKPKDGLQLTEENLHKVMEKEKDPMRRAVFLLLADTGLRPVEARMLTWFEISERSDGHWIGLERSKTEEGLKPVPLSAHVVKAIEALPKKSSYIFQSSVKADCPFGETCLRDWWREAQERADVPVTNLYELRHFFGSMMAKKVKEDVLARLMRHTDSRTSFQYYVRAFDEDLRKAKE